MTPHLVCPKGCATAEGEPPFVALPSSLGTEIGVLVHADATLANIWEDGTVGVPYALADEWEAMDDLPHCVHCGSEAVWSDAVKAGS